MQEEVENRSVNLVVSTGKLSIRILMTALRKYLDSRSNKRKIRAQTIRSEKRQVKMAGRLERERDRVRKELEGPRGKQTVKQLMQSGKDVHQIPVNQEHFREFRKVLNKYGVDFAVTKGVFNGKPRYLVFFKAKDEQLLNLVLQECTQKQLGMKKPVRKQSVLQTLAKMKAIAHSTPKKAHQKQRSHTR